MLSIKSDLQTRPRKAAVMGLRKADHRSRCLHRERRKAIRRADLPMARVLAEVSCKPPKPCDSALSLRLACRKVLERVVDLWQRVVGLLARRQQITPRGSSRNWVILSCQ